MKVFLGIGSNLGDRQKNITQALKELSDVGIIEKISALYETPALLPKNSPDHWNKPFLNLAVKMECSEAPLKLLNRLKAIERKIGPRGEQQWSPRSLDLDILLFENQSFSFPGLKVPHPEIENRSFVLDPLKDILPSFIPKARKHKGHSPLWMGIINLTPDSFSDGGNFAKEEIFSQTLLNYENMGVHIVDLGAESTRPGAKALTPDEELDRLKPFLKQTFHLCGKKAIRPLISLDTRHVKTAKIGVDLGVDIINDVSGLDDWEMIPLLKDSKVGYILTHSLDVPVRPENVLTKDPVLYLKSWLKRKLDLFEKNNISLDRIFFDPGIGFGKTPLQSLKILRELKSFQSCPVRLLVGHSRKSFMKDFSSQKAELRDLETVGISMWLIQQGVDVLRVHNPEIHIRAFRGWSHVAS